MVKFADLASHIPINVATVGHIRRSKIAKISPSFRFLGETRPVDYFRCEHMLIRKQKIGSRDVSLRTPSLVKSRSTWPEPGDSKRHGPKKLTGGKIYIIYIFTNFTDSEQARFPRCEYF